MGFEVGALAGVVVLGGAVVEQDAVAGFVQDLDQAQPGAHAGVVAAVQADDEGGVGDGRLGGCEEVDARVAAFGGGLGLGSRGAGAVEALVGVAWVEHFAAAAFFRIFFFFFLL